MKRRITGLLICLSLSTLVGCGIFHPEYVKRDPFGYYSEHYDACGPIALERALRELGDPKSRVEISRKIQDSGNSLRTVGSFFHHEMVHITRPVEIKETANHYGYDVRELESIQDLNKVGGVGIVLVWGCIFKKEAHWVCFPVYSTNEMSNYYGKNTKISKIFVLTPKE